VDLILWRHAEAEDGFPDLARALTHKGIRQAQKTAEFLQARLPCDVRVLVSPATRTRQTAEALTSDYTLAPSIAPGASAAAVLQAVRWPDAEGSVLVVGHQPTLGAVAARLLGLPDSSLSVRKSAVWWFSGRERDGVFTVSLKLVMPPELL